MVGRVMGMLVQALQGLPPFVLYLAGINVVTFVLFAIDYAIVCHRGDEDAGLMNGAVLTLFAVAGGALGMFAALAVFTRMHMNKDNIAWWFSSIVCMAVWLAVIGCWSGAIQFDLGSVWSRSWPAWLGVYLLAMNLVTAVVFAVDKRRAVRGGRRTPEAVLLGLSLAGGALGGIVAMRLAHHKTRKWYFAYGLPVFVLLQAAAIVLARGAGAL
jgi:uncharacterized membrane protein YsdA (DUF1294 family)